MSDKPAGGGQGGGGQPKPPPSNPKENVTVPREQRSDKPAQK
jgi:hypothetical protein